MPEEQLKTFLEQVKVDTSLQEKLKAAADADAVLLIAKEAGFMISADDWKNAQISEEELEGIAGGSQISCEVTLCVLPPTICC
ncbi:nif11-like leader peptide domain protein [Synechococcus sp. BIOS-E4-1]|uniref:Nif11-like leader peptide family natural product precursor n=1 Tax=Synechococcus sp. BIOS-E4-1 TaxID=1400864 RepID=UPI001646C86E|nr:Nif11-like leader peptide family natural product precursor [Synechococcus sp. BIOS-E4-1]QNI54218.1 nif11-like leader peptide domain protein [Synechococcus sp. BIOS-E4-1]